MVVGGTMAVAILVCWSGKGPRKESSVFFPLSKFGTEKPSAARDSSIEMISIVRFSGL